LFPSIDLSLSQYCEYGIFATSWLLVPSCGQFRFNAFRWVLEKPIHFSIYGTVIALEKPSETNRISNQVKGGLHEFQSF